ncbi:MAG: efflux RND transporter periplasmic adaptor subunit [Candidatus Zixiibacteriota bacterium]
MKKLLIIIIPLLIVAAVLIWSNVSSRDAATDDFAVEVKSGQFIVDVTTTGELEAINKEFIRAPMGLRNIGIHQIKINDIIPEGTVVDSGDYVAMLDDSEIIDRIKDVETELEKLNTQYTKTQLDTTLRLREARENLINLEYAYEEQKLVLEQSEFEPPATIRQNEIQLEKAERAYEQAKQNYEIKKRQAKADMREVAASLAQVRRRYEMIKEFFGKLRITAPKSGMVIYIRSWGGEKLKSGSNLRLWDGKLATLPDLSAMASKTYVNEIDISKIRKGQDAEIQVDAFPEEEYDGKVTYVANIGEQMPGSDAKVFEVKIEVEQTDSILRPAMTTKNRIITNVIDSAIYVPLEAIHNSDSLTYVFEKSSSGIIKKQVITGKNNANEIIILAGLEKGDKVLLTIPENAKEMKIESLPQEVIEEIDTSDYQNDKNPVEADTLDVLKNQKLSDSLSRPKSMKDSSAIDSLKSLDNDSLEVEVPQKS